MTRFVGGRPKRIWIKTGRNEQLDLAVYALAALQALGPATVRNLGGIAKQLAEQGTALKAQEAAGTASEAASDSADDPPDDGGYVRSGMGPWQF